jgi:hypothetical protein
MLKHDSGEESMNIDSEEEQKRIVDSVERGWFELHSGMGDVVKEDDTFFNSIKKELLDMQVR